MTIIEFLNLIEHHPFILYYYAFSMILSILLGRLFLRLLGHQRIWNYFFSFLLYMMSVIGVFSLILFFYQLFMQTLAVSLPEILIPFFTMIVAILMIRNRVNITLLTGFGYSWTFFLVLFAIILLFFLVNYRGWLLFSSWPISLFLLFLVLITVVVRLVIHYFQFRKADET